MSETTQAPSVMTLREELAAAIWRGMLLAYDRDNSGECISIGEAFEIADTRLPLITAACTALTTAVGDFLDCHDNGSFESEGQALDALRAAFAEVSRG